jgi:hypothetical protein
MVRRTQTVYVTTDPFFSPRGKVLHGFDRFLGQLAQVPCVWITGWTRAQLDEPRRRLGQGDPYIGENGCGVYLPEDYFHLKGANTIRLGRYTCIPIAKPQPAAADALEELSGDLDLSVVPLRSLSQRELSQNTGLPAKEADLIRLRDFDELFFFAGASEADITRFQSEAKARGQVVQHVGQFWSFSCGANLAKCVRELGGLYDRALRSHALRIGVRVEASGEDENGMERDSWPAAAFDRTLFLTGRNKQADGVMDSIEENLPDPAADGLESEAATSDGSLPRSRYLSRRPREFYLHAPDVWDHIVATITR